MFEGLDMGQLMAQAQQLQADMLKAQEELAARRFDGAAGQDAVAVTITGGGDLVDVRIRTDAWDPEDPETLGALVVAAFRAAKEQADAAMKSSMPAMPTLPPGLGF